MIPVLENGRLRKRFRSNYSHPILDALQLRNSARCSRAEHSDFGTKSRSNQTLDRRLLVALH